MQAPSIYRASDVFRATSNRLDERTVIDFVHRDRHLLGMATAFRIVFFFSLFFIERYGIQQMGTGLGDTRGVLVDCFRGSRLVTSLPRWNMI